MNARHFAQKSMFFIPLLIVIFFFLGFLCAPNNPMEAHLLNRFASPSRGYPFGTDSLGRCIFSRLLYGGWTTLSIVLGGSLIIFLLGTAIGMVTSRGVIKENALIDGFINAVTAIPPIAYLIVFVGAWGSGAKTTLIALTISYILRYIKLVRTRTDMEIGKAYIMCAIASGSFRDNGRFADLQRACNILIEVMPFIRCMKHRVSVRADKIHRAYIYLRFFAYGEASIRKQFSKIKIHCA